MQPTLQHRKYHNNNNEVLWDYVRLYCLVIYTLRTSIGCLKPKWILAKARFFHVPATCHSTLNIHTKYGIQEKALLCHASYLATLNKDTLYTILLRCFIFQLNSPRWNITQKKLPHKLYRIGEILHRSVKWMCLEHKHTHTILHLCNHKIGYTFQS